MQVLHIHKLLNNCIHNLTWHSQIIELHIKHIKNEANTYHDYEFHGKPTWQGQHST